MKIRKILVPFIFLITFVFALGSVTTSAHAHNHGEDSNDKHEHSALVHEHENEIEESNLDKETREIICCVAGSPKENWVSYYHLKQSATQCVLAYQNITKCLYCGATTPGPLKEINTHNPQTTPDCPF